MGASSDVAIKMGAQVVTPVIKSCTDVYKVKGAYKISKYENVFKENAKIIDLITSIFKEVVKSDDKTTEYNTNLQNTIVATLEKVSNHQNLSDETLEKIIIEIIENGKSIRESKEKDDARKDEKIKMLKDWSKVGNAMALAVVMIALKKAGIDVKYIKKIFS